MPDSETTDENKVSWSEMIDELTERRKPSDGEKMPLFADNETRVADFKIARKILKNSEGKDSAHKISERDTFLIALLEERKKLAKKELEVQKAEQEKLRTQPVLLRDDERIADISHTIGYLTASSYEADLIISLLKMSRDEILSYITEREETEKQRLEELKKVISEAISRKKCAKEEKSAEPTLFDIE